MKKLEIYQLESMQPIVLRPVQEKLLAGGYSAFPSAASDFPEDTIDFLKLLVKDITTTFPGRISGDSMKDIGVLNDDWCLIQKDIEARPNDLVAANIDGQFFIKRFRPKYRENNLLRELKLQSANPDYLDFDITEQTEFVLWGVVTWTFRQHRNL